MTKEDVAAALDEIGTLLELKGETSSAPVVPQRGAGAARVRGRLRSTGRRRPRGRDPRHRRDDAEKIETLVKTGELP